MLLFSIYIISIYGIFKMMSEIYGTKNTFLIYFYISTNLQKLKNFLQHKFLENKYIKTQKIENRLLRDTRILKKKLLNKELFFQLSFSYGALKYSL